MSQSFRSSCLKLQRSPYLHSPPTQKALQFFVLKLEFSSLFCSSSFKPCANRHLLPQGQEFIAMKFRQSSTFILALCWQSVRLAWEQSSSSWLIWLRIVRSSSSGEDSLVELPSREGSQQQGELSKWHPLRFCIPIIEIKYRQVPYRRFQLVFQHYNHYSSATIMISFLNKKRESKLTAYLPQQLKANKQSAIYFRSITTQNDKLQEETASNTVKLDIDSCPEAILNEITRRTTKKQQPEGNHCVTCGKSNISVKYFGQNHMCVECRTFITNEKGHQVRIFLDEDNRIVCVGIKLEDNGKKTYYNANPDKLTFFGKRCYPTYAGSTELIVLLAHE